MLRCLFCREYSGLVVAAKKSRLYDDLKAKCSCNQVQRTYLALHIGTPEGKVMVEIPCSFSFLRRARIAPVLGIPKKVQCAYAPCLHYERQLYPYGRISAGRRNSGVQCVLGFSNIWLRQHLSSAAFGYSRIWCSISAVTGLVFQ